MDVESLRRDGEVTLVLIRHGRTSWNAARRFLGRTDICLDDVGHAEAARLRGVIAGSFDAVYTSPLSRAAETAAYLAPPAPIGLEGLQELSQGELEGLIAEEAIPRFGSFFEDWVRDPETARVPGGETLGACRDRAISAVQQIVKRESGVVAVVTHQMVLASLACWWLDEPLTRWRDHRVGNTCAIVVRHGGGGWSLEEMNWDPSAPSPV